MTRFHKHLFQRAGGIILALFCLGLPVSLAHADVAPPESPPGVIISPGSDVTQVRMVSESVTLTIISSGEQTGKAKTTAIFLMKNLGLQTEDLSVRFPLTFGDALYYENVYPDISDFSVLVDGQAVAPTRISSTDENSGREIPWASFPVRFPVGQEVKITVTYTAEGFGNLPFITYRYILETGAGWLDTIGSGDITIQLPYTASSENVLIDPDSGFSQAAGAPKFLGNEVSWHFENLEPTSFENFRIDLVDIRSWRKVITERENTSRNPQDGEAWGRLGKAIKDAARYSRGYFRDDAVGEQLFKEAASAYENAVRLLPKDALWHYGYADLLWSHYFYSEYFGGSQDYSELARLVDEIRISLELDPNNQDVLDLADWISGSLPWAISRSDQGLDYFILTATPTLIPATATQLPEITPESPATEIAKLPTMDVEETETPRAILPTQSPLPATEESPATGKTPFCASVLFIPMLFGLGWLFTRRK